MELNYAVVHELQKEAGETRARENLATALLSAQSHVVVDLVAQIVGLIGQRENMAQYGIFRDDPASTRVPDIVRSYCLAEDTTSDRFLTLTNGCMVALRDRAQSQNLATGGYLLFADYTTAGRRFFLVAMIKQRSGITMQGLVPTSITELDLRKLHQVARVAFDRLRQYEESPAERQNLPYVAFVSPKGAREAAGYFVTALGCEPGTPAAVATKSVVQGTNEFFSKRPSIEAYKYEAKEAVVQFLLACADSGERARLLDVVEVVRQFFPPADAPNLADDLSTYLQGDARSVPAEFPVAKSIATGFARFKYRSNQLKVEIDKAAVTRQDIGPIYFDEQHRRLVISDDDFITRLADALRDRD